MRPLKKPAPLLAVSLGVALTATLTGCAGAAAPKPTPSMKAHTAHITKVPCVDGKATVSKSNARITLADDCTNVTIKASNNIVTATSLTTVTIDGSINRIEASSVTTVLFTAASKANSVVHGGSKPTVSDKGDSNTVTRQSTTP
jgi:ABC-type uncharacterized transport system auxiliary subunit